MTETRPVEQGATRLHRLEQEIAGLRRAMRNRGVIEQAKGMLAERLRCDPESAFATLARWSQAANVPVAQLAADVVAAGPPAADTAEQVERAQALVRFGWATWEPHTGIGHWSAGLQRLLGRTGQHPPDLDRWPELFLAPDQPAALELVRQWIQGVAATADLRVLSRGPSRRRDPQRRPATDSAAAPDRPDQPEGVLTLRASGEPGRPDRPPDGVLTLRVSGEPGRPADSWSVLITAHDVTEHRDVARRLRRAEHEAGAGRLLLAAQQQLTGQLAQLVHPGGDEIIRLPDGWLRRRQHVPADVRTVRGEFGEVRRLSSADTAIVIGDLPHAGLSAVAALLRLCEPAMALAAAGLPPEQTLNVLNARLRPAPTSPGRTASAQDPRLVGQTGAPAPLSATGPAAAEAASDQVAQQPARLGVGGYSSGARVLSWSSAGQLPPVLLRDGQPTVLLGPAGPLLGSGEDHRYQATDVQLRRADIVLWCTHGMLRRQPTGPTLDAFLPRVECAWRAGGPDALLDLVDPAPDQESCLVVLTLDP